jgi:hypothetical protein
MAGVSVLPPDSGGLKPAPENMEAGSKSSRGKGTPTVRSGQAEDRRPRTADSARFVIAQHPRTAESARRSRLLPENATTEQRSGEGCWDLPVDPAGMGFGERFEGWAQRSVYRAKVGDERCAPTPRALGGCRWCGFAGKVSLTQPSPFGGRTTRASTKWRGLKSTPNTQQVSV